MTYTFSARHIFILAGAIFFLSLTGQAHAGIKPPPSNLGLVGYWSFEDCRGATSTDMSGSGNTGSLTNFALSTSTSNWVTGNAAKRGCALNFDGSNDYVALPVNSNYGAVGDVTVSMWIKPTDYVSSNNYILDTRSNGGNSNGIAVYRNSQNVINFYIQTGTYPADPATTKSATVTMNAGVWIHIVAIRSGTAYRIYANGVQSGTDSAGTGSTFSLLDVGGRIGTYSNGTGAFVWNGSLDDVRIYNRALSPTEITALYNSGSAKIQTVSQGLVGSWQFSEGAGTSTRDTSPSGNTGTLTNFALTGTTTSTWVQGRTGSGYALNFDGSDDYVDIPNSTLWDFGSNPMAVSMWVRFDSSKSSFLLMQKSGAGNGGFEFWWNANSLLFSFSSITNAITKTWVPSLNTWHHVVYTRSGNVHTLYVNGASIGSTTTAGSVEDVTGALRIGGRDVDGGYELDGSLDDVRVYNRALSLQEIRNLYNTGAVKANASTAQLQQGTSLASGLVGHWTFDGQYLNTTTSTDTSGSGNDGTLGSGTAKPKPALGKLGQALSFDGSNDVVTAPENGSLDIATALTLSFWMKQTTADASDRSIIDKGIWTSANYELRVSTGNIRLLSNGAGASQHVYQTTSAVPVGVWTHVAVSQVGGDGSRPRGRRDYII